MTNEARTDWAGDDAGFERVVAPLWHRLVNYAWHRLDDKGAAEDVAQEAGLVLHRNRDRVGASGAPAYLFATARNLCLNRNRLARPLPLAEVAEPASSDATPAAETRRDLAAALATLGPETRDLLLLRFLGDLTVPEIAAELGIKEGTVKSRLHAGCQRLKERLKGYGEAR